MAEFLTTHGIAYQIERIITEAQKKLVLVSPYLQLSKLFFERLKDASSRGVNIQIIYGKDALKQSERDSLEELKNLELYFFENLHAKCYFNEKKMVITSMNMYSFSEKNNREMGVLILSEIDKELFKNAVDETLSIVSSSQKETLKFNGEVRKAQPLQKVHEAPKNAQPLQKVYEAQKTANPEEKGYCIRCHAYLPLNEEKPFCRKCYESWAEFENDEYVEKYCHGCGREGFATMAKPLCLKCYNGGMDNQNYTILRLFDQLKDSYPKKGINKASDYVYFTRIMPSVDAFITCDSVSLKFTQWPADIKDVSATERRIMSVLDQKVDRTEPGETSSCYRWNIHLKKKVVDEVFDVVKRLHSIKHY